MDIGLNAQYDYLNKISMNPYAVGTVLVIIILYFVLFASLGSNSAGEASPTSNSSALLLETILWAIFVALILLNGMSYIFNINIVAGIKNLFTGVPEIDIAVSSAGPSSLSVPTLSDTIPEIKRKPQVFHLPNNTYTYEDSRAICSAYGGRLATYSEIEDAHKKGADWCGFGWSDKQMALYPTQMEKWNNLQTIEGHQHDCGRPGINGGYIDNPNVRFGVNCYGYKPKITDIEIANMSNNTLYPKTNKELAFDQKVDFWKQQLASITVAPFNHNNWSII
jgi:hypothetical protein